MKVKSESEVAQLCPTLSDPMDCSLPGSSVHGIFQAKVLEWGATAFSGSLPLPNPKYGFKRQMQGRRGEEVRQACRDWRSHGGSQGLVCVHVVDSMEKQRQPRKAYYLQGPSYMGSSEHSQVQPLEKAPNFSPPGRGDAEAVCDGKP